MRRRGVWGCEPETLLPDFLLASLGSNVSENQCNTYEVDVVTPFRDAVRRASYAGKVAIGNAVDERAINVQDKVSNTRTPHDVTQRCLQYK
jgi:hypothetical protein